MLDGAGFQGGSSAVMNSESKPESRMGGRMRRMTCRLLKDVLRAHELHHVDFLSLDIEGHEIAALQGWDPYEVSIDIIISENVKIWDMLRSFGYRRFHTSRNFQDAIYLRPGFKLAIEQAGQAPMDWWNMPRCNGSRLDPSSKSGWYGILGRGGS